MALNKEFFDAINIDVVKKKYYNANKVNALLEDIRSQAEALYEENQQLKAQLDELARQKQEIGETLLRANATAREVEERAKAQAEEILKAAQQQSERILDGSLNQEEYAAGLMHSTFEMLKAQQQDNIKKLDELWREYLCGLYREK